MRQKYIVVDRSGTEEIITFPTLIRHDRMFAQVAAVKTGGDQNWTRDYRDAKVIAAGFVDNGDCQGRSESLKIESRGAIDTALLKRSLGFEESEPVHGSAPTSPGFNSPEFEGIKASSIVALPPGITRDDTEHGVMYYTEEHLRSFATASVEAGAAGCNPLAERTVTRHLSLVTSQPATCNPADPSSPRTRRHPDTSHVGRDLGGMPQPFAGAVVLLETIAECGAIAFFDDGTRTPNSELCQKFAEDLRMAGKTALQAYGQIPYSSAIRNDALESAAALCDAESKKCADSDIHKSFAIESLANNIRALKSTSHDSIKG